MKPLFTLACAATLLAATLIEAAATTPNPVVRRAPELTWRTPDGRTASLSKLQNQPVVLLIAPSPRSSSFRKQLARVEDVYRRLAARQALFFAAFTQQEGQVSSDIPFIVLPNGAGVAAAYGAEASPFTLAVIGPDGNLDLITTRVVGGIRIRDVIDNSYEVQARHRRMPGSR